MESCWCDQLDQFSGNLSAAAVNIQGHCGIRVITQITSNKKIDPSANDSRYSSIHLMREHSETSK